jgi:hypothetical protein
VVRFATRDWHGGDRSGGGALCNFYDIGNGEVLMSSSQAIAQTVPEASGPTAVPMTALTGRNRGWNRLDDVNATLPDFLVR